MTSRRSLLVLAAAVALGAAGTLPRAANAETLDYTPGMIDALLAEGRTLFVSFAASWCGVCRAQRLAVDRWRGLDPSYDAVTFVRVDWDTYAEHDIVARHAIPRRSTLIVLKGEAELGRLEAGANAIHIRDLMDIARAAASGS